MMPSRPMRGRAGALKMPSVPGGGCRRYRSCLAQLLEGVQPVRALPPQQSVELTVDSVDLLICPAGGGVGTVAGGEARAVGPDRAGDVGEAPRLLPRRHRSEEGGSPGGDLRR